MSYRKGSVPWNTNQVSKMVSSGKVSFDNIIQRGYVWDISRKSKLITSLIMGIPIPPVFAKKSEDKLYDILDGKQRLVTISKFLNDEFKLSGIEPFEYTEEVTGEKFVADIAGKKFSELPEDLQEIIKTRSITIYYFDDITEEETRELFQRLNNGKALTTKEKNIAYCNDLEKLVQLGKHRIFEDMLTKRAYDSKSYVTIIAKMYQMLTVEIENVSFSAAKFNEYISSINLTKEDMDMMAELFDDIEFVHDTISADTEKASRKIAKKMYKEIHLVSLVPFFKKAEEKEIDMSIFADWVMKFFFPEDKTSISDEYNAACLDGTAKPENIQKRNRVLAENFETFFEKGDEEKSE